MRYTALSLALIALAANLTNISAVNLCPGAPASLANTNRPYSGYKYADASWGIEKAVSDNSMTTARRREEIDEERLSQFEAGYAANMVDCVDRCRQNHRKYYLLICMHPALMVCDCSNRMRLDRLSRRQA